MTALKIRKPKYAAVVGRISDWLKSNEGRLPASCKVIDVWPGMESENGIKYSWGYLSYGLRNGAGVAINQSNFVAQAPINFSWQGVISAEHPDAKLFDPEAVYPVDAKFLCRVIRVADSMEDGDAEKGLVSIEESWQLFEQYAREGFNFVVDLSALRPAASNNGRGLVASGPHSFMAIYNAIAAFLRSGDLVSLMSLYSSFNATLRRGGLYKNGAITFYLSWDHPDVLAFLNADPSQFEWLKRALYVTPELLEDKALCALILKRVREGRLWLAKPQYNAKGERLYSNVCLEILLPSRGTCLISHHNLGKCPVEDIPEAMVEGMEFLCTIHASSGIGSKYDLSGEEDRQVGLGMVGLANLLALEGVKYAEFVPALEHAVDLLQGLTLGTDAYGTQESADLSQCMGVFGVSDGLYPERAAEIVEALVEGYHRAALVARAHRMERAFTLAPTASVSYRHRDRQNFTTTPEISPPLARVVDRDSGTFGVQQYDYGNVETAEEVGWDIQYRLMKAWQGLMDATGLAHSISFNVWSTCAIDQAWLEDWMASPLKTTYYVLPVNTVKNLDKSKIVLRADLEQDATVFEAPLGGHKSIYRTLKAMEPIKLRAFASTTPVTVEVYANEKLVFSGSNRSDALAFGVSGGGLSFAVGTELLVFVLNDSDDTQAIHTQLVFDGIVAEVVVEHCTACAE